MNKLDQITNSGRKKIDIIKNLDTKLQDRKHISFSKKVSVKPGDIQYIEKVGNYTVIHLYDKQPKKAKITLKQALGLLPESLFVQVHKSFAINLKYYDSQYDGKVILTNGTALSVGRNFKSNLDQALGKD